MPTTNPREVVENRIADLQAEIADLDRIATQAEAERPALIAAAEDARAAYQSNLKPLQDAENAVFSNGIRHAGATSQAGTLRRELADKRAWMDRNRSLFPDPDQPAA